MHILSDEYGRTNNLASISGLNNGLLSKFLAQPVVYEIYNVLVEFAPANAHIGWFEVAVDKPSLVHGLKTVEQLEAYHGHGFNREMYQVFRFLFIL